MSIVKVLSSFIIFFALFAIYVVSSTTATTTATIDSSEIVPIDSMADSGQAGSGIVLYTNGFLRRDSYDASNTWISAELIAIGTCVLYSNVGGVPLYTSYPKLKVLPTGVIVVSQNFFSVSDCTKLKSSKIYKYNVETTYTNEYGTFTIKSYHSATYSKAIQLIPTTQTGFLIKKYYNSGCSDSSPLEMYLASQGCKSYGDLFGNTICDSSLGLSFTSYPFIAANPTCTIPVNGQAFPLISTQCSPYVFFESDDVFNYQTIECITARGKSFRNRDNLMI